MIDPDIRESMERADRARREREAQARPQPKRQSRVGGKFRKKPIVVDAVLCIEREEIATLEGVMVANPGDWIITGVKGERYPCKPDIFAATYEAVEP